jgi:Fe-S oxidoreductase
LKNNFTSSLLKNSIGFASKRSIPTLYKTTLISWLAHNPLQNSTHQSVYLFADEFTNYNDVEIGIKAIKLLRKLGYNVLIPNVLESGRTYLSKGLLRKAKSIAEKNVEILSSLVNNGIPLIGIEPSAILSFRDEYPDLVRKDLKEKASKLAKNALLFEEFIQKEIEKGMIGPANFTNEPKVIKLHGHCQQKAVASTAATLKMLSLPENYSISEIPSGCCGMAGSFGYEKEHYDLSQKIGELVLFPTIRKMNSEEILVAAGTSCRHQIKDGTNKKALHPVEVMLDALI